MEEDAGREEQGGRGGGRGEIDRVVCHLGFDGVVDGRQERPADAVGAAEKKEAKGISESARDTREKREERWRGGRREARGAGT